MDHAARLPGPARLMFEDDDIPRTGCLELHERRIAVHDLGTEKALVELSGSRQVADRKRDVSQAVGLDHVTLPSLHSAGSASR